MASAIQSNNTTATVGSRKRTRDALTSSSTPSVDEIPQILVTVPKPRNEEPVASAYSGSYFEGSSSFKPQENPQPKSEAESRVEQMVSFRRGRSVELY